MTAVSKCYCSEKLSLPVKNAIKFLLLSKMCGKISRPRDYIPNISSKRGAMSYYIFFYFHQVVLGQDRIIKLCSAVKALRKSSEHRTKYIASCETLARFRSAISCSETLALRRINEQRQLLNDPTQVFTDVKVWYLLKMW